MKSFFLLLLAVAVSMLVIPAARRLAPHIGMVDMPDPRKVHRAPIPRVGGCGIALGALLPLLLLLPADPAVRAWLAGGMLLFAFGMWDDARQISHWPKFLGQALATGIVVFYGDLYVTRLPFIDGDVLPPLVGQLFTMVAMIGVINAVNHSDGLDGLAGGETLLSLVAICFLGHLSGNAVVTDIALAVIGGIIGFLRFNTHPAMVFMGDAGSQFLGFTLAFLSIYLVQVANSATSAALPLLLIGLPIADILAVLYQRMRGGMNWFKATRNHVHHRLLDLGHTHYESVVAIYSLQALLVTCAVLLRYAADGLVLGLYLAVVVALFAALAWAERTGWRVRRGDPNRISWLTRLPQYLRQKARVRVPLLLVALLPVPLFIAGTTLWSSEVPRDLGLGAAGIGLVLAALLLFGDRAPGTAVRAAVYVAATFSTWLFVRYPGTAAQVAFAIANGGMFLIAAVLALYVRFMARQRFELTPTDYLIAFASLALALFVRFSGGKFGAENLLQFALYLVVLFYACEVVIGNTARWRSFLGVPATLALGIMAIRGIA
jgi:UDP-GlcNAc:undecaprenyl-phosphate/decaprenyl-phosphate GlcNAc-1-phosphate transferase